MRKNTLKMLGILIVSTTLFASVFTGCGSKETDSVQETEQVEAVLETETEEPETEEIEEETEELMPEGTEQQEEPAFIVKDMSATKYAKQSVNVRKGPSADYEKLGGLSANQKVTVTGQADTGWYRIEYNGAEGYVSDKYLADQKTVSASTSGTNTNSTTNVVSNNTTGGSTGGNSSSASGATGNNTSGNTSSGNAGSGTSGSSNDSGVTGSADGNTTSGSMSGGSDSGTSGSNVTDSASNNNGNAATDTGNAGSTAPAGSVIDPNTGMYIPSDIVIEEDDGSTGADDGTGLSGGTSTWY